MYLTLFKYMLTNFTTRKYSSSHLLQDHFNPSPSLLSGQISDAMREYKYY